MKRVVGAFGLVVATALAACGTSKPKQAPAKPVASSLAGETGASIKIPPEYTRMKKGAGAVDVSTAQK